jgi:hypothetical protein
VVTDSPSIRSRFILPLFGHRVFTSHVLLNLFFLQFSIACVAYTCCVVWSLMLYDVYWGEEGFLTVVRDINVVIGSVIVDMSVGEWFRG